MDNHEEQLSKRELRRQQKKERKELRMQHRREWRELRRSRFLPARLWGWLVNLTVLTALILGLRFGWPYCMNLVNSVNEELLYEELETSVRENLASEDEILAQTTVGVSLDSAEEAGYSSGDTWAFYFYMSGSDLESWGTSELSTLTDYLLEDVSFEYQSRNEQLHQERITTFLEELNSRGMDLPNSMYLPEAVAAEDESSASYAPGEGGASADLEEMFTVDLPENVKLVIQAGGARRWSTSLVNPNRTTRLLYDQSGVLVLDELPVQNMGEADTLADFLSYCEEEYPADHKVLIFWNHGSGVAGFCHDELYEDSLRLRELQTALQTVYGTDPSEPPLELVGFDACLMGTVEVAEVLHGYTGYLAASEEIEPGDGWDYARLFTRFAEDTSVNGAGLGRLIADSCCDFYGTYNHFYSQADYSCSATFSVTDVRQAHSLYEAYCDFAEAALLEVMREPGTLAAIGRAAGESLAYGGSSSRIFNSIDLGLFMEALSVHFPEECSRVLEALDEAVLYSRTTNDMTGSRGLAVYYPLYMDELSALKVYLLFADEVCENDAIRALYYYKVGGCLNDELTAYVNTLGVTSVPELHSEVLEELAVAELTFPEEGGYQLTAAPETLAMAESLRLSLADYDEDTGEVIYLGEGALIDTGSDGTVRAELDGSWIGLGGQLLAAGLINSSETTDKFGARVLINDRDCYLLFEHNKLSDRFTITGTTPVSSDHTDLVSRSEISLKPGDVITPVYQSSNLDDRSATSALIDVCGESFTYKEGMTVEKLELTDGTYLSYITAFDPRGNVYYSPVVYVTADNGTLSFLAADDLYALQTR